jgi:hypothetical protein
MGMAARILRDPGAPGRRHCFGRAVELQTVNRNHSMVAVYFRTVASVFSIADAVLKPPRAGSDEARRTGGLPWASYSDVLESSRPRLFPQTASSQEARAKDGETPWQPKH